MSFSEPRGGGGGRRQEQSSLQDDEPLQQINTTSFTIVGVLNTS